MSEEARNPVENLVNQDPNSLFPPLLNEIEELTEFVKEHPGEELTYEKIYETICGAADDSQEVEQYDGTLGVTVAFVNTHQSPVGQLQWNNNLATIFTNPGNVAGVRWCSGTLITNDLFLTAGHCFDQNAGNWQLPRQNGTTNVIQPADIATNMQVNFNFQVDPTGNPRVEQSFPVTQLVEHRLGELDFAIVRLGGSPGLIYGTTRISNVDAVLNSMACIIGHPAGRRKRIEAGPITLLQGDSIGYNDIDTLGGNSGSGILRDPDGQIVGVHTHGGCDAAMTGNNSGVRITSIIAQSPTVQSLLGISTIDIPNGEKELAADGDSLYFVRKDNGQVWRYNGSSWNDIDVGNNPGKRIAASGGNLYQVHTSGSIWRYNGSSWDQIGVTPAGTQIAAGSTQLYAAYPDGRIIVIRAV